MFVIFIFKTYTMSELKDPLGNRVVKTVLPPFQQSLSEKQLFNEKGVNWETLRDFLKREGKLAKNLVEILIKKALQIFSTFMVYCRGLTQHD